MTQMGADQADFHFGGHPPQGICFHLAMKLICGNLRILKRIVTP